MKLAIVLTILLLLLDIWLGSQAFGYGLFLIYALVFFVSLIIGIIVSARILVVLKGQKKEISPLFHIFIVPLYVAISLPLVYLTSTIVLNINNAQSDAQESLEAKKQNFNSVKRGTIIHSDSTLIYECKQCGYRVKFPSTWGFGEDDLSSDYGSFRQVLRLVTFDYQKSFNKPKGVLLYIDSSQDPQVDRTLSTFIKDLNNGPSWSTPFNYIERKTTIGNYAVTMNISHNDALAFPYNGYIRFSNKGNFYIIQVEYGDEDSFNKALNILLENFQQIE